MFLHVISPTGAYSCLDLVALPAWRLDLAPVVPVPAPQAAPNEKSALGLRLSYLAGGAVAWAIIAAVDVRSPDDAIAIAEVGLVAGEHQTDKVRINEAAKALYNNESVRKEADTIIPQVAALVDVYYGLLGAFADVGTIEGQFGHVGPKYKGELAGWRFAITTLRFEPWRQLANTTPSGDRAPPAPDDLAAPIVPAISATSPRVNTLGGKPPKPDEEYPGRSKRPSREKLRQERAQAEVPASPLPSTPPVEPVAEQAAPVSSAVPASSTSPDADDV